MKLSQNYEEIEGKYEEIEKKIKGRIEKILIFK